MCFSLFPPPRLPAPLNPQKPTLIKVSIMVFSKKNEQRKVKRPRVNPLNPLCEINLLHFSKIFSSILIVINFFGGEVLIGILTQTLICVILKKSRSPFSVLRSPFSVLRSPFSVLRSPFSVLRSPFSNQH